MTCFGTGGVNSFTAVGNLRRLKGNHGFSSRMKTAIVVPCLKAQLVRKLLEKKGLWDQTRKLQKQDTDKVAIPVTTDDATLLSQHLPQDVSLQIVQINLPCSKSHLIVTPAEHLHQSIKQLLEQHITSESVLQKLLLEVPSRWEKHGDLVLLPASAFLSAEWRAVGKKLWEAMAKSVGVQRVARQSVVSADGFRRPQVTLLLGDSGVVQHIDNEIKYEYDITRCMFSSGNVTEKLRIAHFNCERETVVDMFAGIGYFTLPYLVHAKASHVIACEWNPDAVAALKRNLELNNVHHRCTIIPGDNRQLSLKGVADRVNLGLIPSSEDSWPIACRVLKQSGGFLHIHGNVNTHSASCEQLLCLSTASGNIVKDSVGIAESTNIEDQRITAEDDPNQTKQLGINSDNGDVSAGFAEPDLNSDSTILSVTSGCHCATSDQNTFSVSHRSAQMTPVRSDDTRDANVLFSVGNQLESGNSALILSESTEDYPCRTSKKSLAWSKWGETVCARIKTLVEGEHGGCWLVTVTHTESVKSYAPHVHHVVLDIRCTPVDSLGDQ